MKNKKFLFTIILTSLITISCKTQVQYDCNCNSSGNSGSSNVVYSSGTTKYPGVADNVPRVGKIYYSDGTVSEFYNSAKTPVGIVALLKQDGSVKCIAGLYTNTIGIEYTAAVTYCKNYDAGVNFYKNSWKLLPFNDSDTVAAGFNLIQYGFDQLLIGGYTGTLQKFSYNTNIWVEKVNSSYYYWSTDSGAKNSTSSSSTLFAKPFLYL